MSYLIITGSSSGCSRSSSAPTTHRPRPFKNIGFLGAGYGYAKLFGPIDAAVVVIGIALAFYYKIKFVLPNGRVLRLKPKIALRPKPRPRFCAG
jgi:hypothetical protein